MRVDRAALTGPKKSTPAWPLALHKPRVRATTPGEPGRALCSHLDPVPTHGYKLVCRGNNKNLDLILVAAVSNPGDMNTRSDSAYDM